MNLLLQELNDNKPVGGIKTIWTSFLIKELPIYITSKLPIPISITCLLFMTIFVIIRKLSFHYPLHSILSYFFFHFKLYSILLILSLHQDPASLRLYLCKLSSQILQFFWIRLGVPALKIDGSEYVVTRRWLYAVEPCQLLLHSISK